MQADLPEFTILLLGRRGDVDVLDVHVKGRSSLPGLKQHLSRCRDEWVGADTRQRPVQVRYRNGDVDVIVGPGKVDPELLRGKINRALAQMKDAAIGLGRIENGHVVDGWGKIPLTDFDPVIGDFSIYLPVLEERYDRPGEGAHDHPGSALHNLWHTICRC